MVVGGVECCTAWVAPAVCILRRLLVGRVDMDLGGNTLVVRVPTAVQ